MAVEVAEAEALLALAPALLLTLQAPMPDSPPSLDHSALLLV